MSARAGRVLAFVLAAACAFALRANAAEPSAPDTTLREATGMTPWRADSIASAKKKKARAPVPVMARAREAFRYRHFDRVEALLGAALASNSLPARERPQALELLGRSAVRVGDVELGVARFGALLDAAPTWTLDAHEAAGDELAVFARAKREWREAHPDWSPPAAAQVPFYRQRRWQLAAGAATATIVAIVRHNAGGGSHEPLPELPGHP